MNHFSPRARRTEFYVSLTCTLLFTLFSVSYLFMLHGWSLSSLHVMLSEGKTAYSPFWGAVIITVVLWLVQWGARLFARFRNGWQAVAYFPAYLGLTVLSSVHPDVAEDGQRFSVTFADGLWWWTLLLLALFIGLSVVCRRLAGRNRSGKTAGYQQQIIPCLLTLIAFSYLTGMVGNNNEIFHNELALEQAIRQHRPEEVMTIGRKSLHNSRTLSALRARALSETDSLGCHLFTFPQWDRADGLFFDESRGAVSPLTNADLYRYLGGKPRIANETPVHYLHRLCTEYVAATDTVDTVSHKAIDYYLCALLLDRQLNAFVQAFHTYYDGGLPLPRHYQEALLLHEEREKSVAKEEEVSPEVRSRYEAFKEMQAEYEDPIPQQNYTRRKFGDTYWWYFWYGE